MIRLIKHMVYRSRERGACKRLLAQYKTGMMLRSLTVPTDHPINDRLRPNQPPHQHGGGWIIDEIGHDGIVLRRGKKNFLHFSCTDFEKMEIEIVRRKKR